MNRSKKFKMYGGYVDFLAIFPKSRYLYSFGTDILDISSLLIASGYLESDFV
jgi:hypothetical protein